MGRRGEVARRIQLLSVFSGWLPLRIVFGRNWRVSGSRGRLPQAGRGISNVRIFRLDGAIWKMSVARRVGGTESLEERLVELEFRRCDEHGGSNDSSLRVCLVSPFFLAGRLARSWLICGRISPPKVHLARCRMDYPLYFLSLGSFSSQKFT